MGDIRPLFGICWFWKINHSFETTELYRERSLRSNKPTNENVSKCLKAFKTDLRNSLSEINITYK